MAKKKQDTQPSFLKKKGSSGATQQVSARIPQELFNSFKTAQEVADKNGMELPLTDVIVSAMKQACREVKSEFPNDFQSDLQFDSDE